ncbi:metallophosphoesterase [Carnobacterium divergens]|uniref:Serine/threonine protein phosphatase n=1 Tax=Carnobacterium divergens TaxID=2748 RepID=A0A7Z8D003_CARDV|nr:metallophosphoesterase [Carnobacterium divergens]TFI73512.1 serine/threonine protein phosphatase [Carnobacterium divergens]TFI77459.1 serine/threonine protein phosphatase [Carnobacterium divergens]TFI84223.1 serine/threonine protein phosphatase [Carnobacterium divergens]TFI96069.1 serine/threonine protein phosphatase [Carnobacterium divergens]TFJ12372.1 serine/threonine protein phosphatase [Carnobacterium divergens]
MNTREVLAIGDIHGQIQLFEEMLTHWKEATQQLVLIGDLGDRGENPKACFLLGKKLVEEKQAIYLKGNHEDLLLRFLADPEERYENYCLNGGMRTLESLLHTGLEAEYSPTEISMLVKSHYPELIEFLNGLPLYFEWQDYVFVHAGVDLTKSDWKKTSERDFMWIREPFHTGENKTGKTIVFGHTITPSLHGDNETTSLWQQDHKVGIDGGAVYGGVLHGVVFDKKQLVEDIVLVNKGYVWDGER